MGTYYGEVAEDREVETWFRLAMQLAREAALDRLVVRLKDPLHFPRGPANMQLALESAELDLRRLDCVEEIGTTLFGAFRGDEFRSSGPAQALAELKRRMEKC